MSIMTNVSVPSTRTFFNFKQYIKKKRMSDLRWGCLLFCSVDSRKSRRWDISCDSRSTNKEFKSQHISRIP